MIRSCQPTGTPLSDNSKTTGLPGHKAPPVTTWLNRVVGIARHASGRAIVICSTVVAVVGFLSITDSIHINFLNLIRYGEIPLARHCRCPPLSADERAAVNPFLGLKPREAAPAPAQTAIDPDNLFKGIKRQPTTAAAAPAPFDCQARDPLPWCGLRLPYRWVLSVCVTFAGVGLIRWRARPS
jgi:hypothetical protein